ncbi:hypothetical protein CUJ91_28925 [Paraburkholderia graminis]|uniref:glutathionylspermidine synthase family protein n=1 Tax=Paraburkholderia graminis TaxID=60548 RepID=UPI000DEF2934|nr:glutathionylspermidine synthase family protein [Paraburkholderia graminis]AXF11841.1 hypothetical protein CUJ91_28925 [Paraburkholderia graminis]
MKRTKQIPRANWPTELERIGFHFHSLDEHNQPRKVDRNTFYYWREDAAYEFSEAQIESLYAAARELNSRCLEAVQHVIDHDRFSRMAIAPEFAELIRKSWDSDEPTLFGRFDMTLDAHGVPKMYEYNADTPTSIIESSLAQWSWRESVQPKADQFNSLHEALIARWRWIRKHYRKAKLLHFACAFDSQEDVCNVEYLMDTAVQAGWSVKLVDVMKIGTDSAGRFYDADNERIEVAFKLYPWEWMAQSEYGPQLGLGTMHWVEPPWKAVLSNKAILPILWELFPGHPNLLEASFEEASFDGRPHATKPIYSREGESLTLVTPEGRFHNPGQYGDEGFVYQAYCPARRFGGLYTTLGVWIVDDVPSGLCVREEAGPIAKNTSYFVPHFFRKSGDVAAFGLGERAQHALPAQTAAHSADRAQKAPAHTGAYFIQQKKSGLPKLLLIGACAALAGGTLVHSCSSSDDDSELDEGVPVTRASYETLEDCLADWTMVADCREAPIATQTADVPASDAVASSPTNGVAGSAGGSHTGVIAHWYGPYYTRSGTVYHGDGSQTQQSAQSGPLRPALKYDAGGHPTRALEPAPAHAAFTEQATVAQRILTRGSGASMSMHAAAVTSRGGFGRGGGGGGFGGGGGHSFGGGGWSSGG